MIEISLLLLLFTSVSPLISTGVQGFYVLATLMVGIYRINKVHLFDIICVLLIIFIVLMGVLANEGSFVFSYKNAVYIILMPFLRISIAKNWYLNRLNYFFLLIFIGLAWYQINPNSYITENFGGTPRMVGFGVNPNVWGILCLLILSTWKIWPGKAVGVKLFGIIVLVLSIYYSGSNTAFLLLPFCFCVRRWVSFLYLATLLVTPFILIYLFAIDIDKIAPSLFARFDLWMPEIESINAKILLIGKGYDYFGSGISTITSDTIRVIDSFYMSSLISGGVPMILLLTMYYFLIPLYYSIKYNNLILLNLIIIFSLANLTGNFLENGFPANIIYWIIFNHLHSINSPEKYW